MNKEETKYTQILGSVAEEFVIRLEEVRSKFKQQKFKTDFRALNKGIFTLNSIQKNPPKLISLYYISDISTKVSRQISFLGDAFSDDSLYDDKYVPLQADKEMSRLGKRSADEMNDKTLFQTQMSFEMSLDQASKQFIIVNMS